VSTDIASNLYNLLIWNELTNARLNEPYSWYSIDVILVLSTIIVFYGRLRKDVCKTTYVSRIEVIAKKTGKNKDVYDFELLVATKL